MFSTQPPFATISAVSRTTGGERRFRFIGCQLAEKLSMRRWGFQFTLGGYMHYRQVEARDEATALAVATAWCLQHGYRAPASVHLAVVADESILEQASEQMPA